MGPGSIYFRGTNSRTQMKSVPADFLVFDEIDEMLPANVELARKRLGHSDLGLGARTSPPPPSPATGSTGSFEESDQRHCAFVLSGLRRRLVPGGSLSRAPRQAQAIPGRRSSS